MKSRLIILLALMSFAGASEFVAYPGSTISFSGCNCRGDNYPNPVELSVSVTNPSPLPLKLSYEWYDPNTGAYRQGDWIKCAGDTDVVFRNSLGSCKLRIYTLMGGLNGTSPINIILIGTNGVLNYTTSFDVELSYHTSPFENNVLSRMQGAEQDLEQLRSSMDGSCYGNSCCGMLALNDYINLAIGNLSAANASLRECQLSFSWSYIMNASNSISAAKESFSPLYKNCSAAVSLINETGLRIVSVAEVIRESKKCGSNVTLSESQLRNANSSLEAAADALASDDYVLAFSKIREANSSIYSSVSSIGKCVSTTPIAPVVVPVKQNSTNSPLNQTSSNGNNTLLILGGAFLALLIFAAAVATVLPFMRRQPQREEAPKTPPEVQPAAPPAQPPAAPPAAHETQEDLEKEFNEWLSSTQKKK